MNTARKPSRRKVAALPPAPLPALTPTVATIVHRIVEVICKQGHEPGQRLVEQSLADSLGVSRSPVRKALQYLEGLGAVTSIPNRGFVLVQRPPELRALALPVSEESDEANYLRIADERLAGALPDEVSESELMERFALSRLQVQRILNRMGREGLAERKPGRGWLFMPFLDSAKAYNEGYRFRMIIEPAALLEPGYLVDKALFGRVRREQLAMLDDGIERWSRAELFRVGAEFHEAIVACAHNSFLLDGLRKLNQVRRLLEYRANVDRTRLYRQCEEHLALLDLIEAGDRMEASHRLRQHLDVVRGIKLHRPQPPQGGFEVHL
jgi:DNA-binding GntR family transcriptional regulator